MTLAPTRAQGRPSHRGWGRRALLPWILILTALLGPGVGLAPAAAAEKPASPPFEEEILRFEAADATNPPPRHAILFTGSSSIRLWASLVTDFPGHPVFGRGFGGSHMSDLNRYASRIVIPYEPRHILVYEGDNDLAAGKTPEEVAAGFREFVRQVHATLPLARISYIAIKPSRARWGLLPKIREANSRIRRYAFGHRHVDYIDTFTPMLDRHGKVREELYREDGLHLNPEGYRVWAGVIRRKL